MRLEQRFWSKVEFNEAFSVKGCWIWKSVTDKLGYGKFHIGGRRGRHYGAYRVAYQLLRGQIPNGMVLDHLCRNPSCVNPDHLEVVTQRVNLLRGDTLAAKEASQTHCKNGHPLRGTNLDPYSLRQGCRRCIICKKQYEHDYYLRSKRVDA